jgi:hypothetical protein
MENNSQEEKLTKVEINWQIDTYEKKQIKIRNKVLC